MVFKDKDLKDLVGLKTNLTYTRFEDKFDLQSFGFEVENLRVNVIKKYLILFFFMREMPFGDKVCHFFKSSPQLHLRNMILNRYIPF